MKSKLHKYCHEPKKILWFWAGVSTSYWECAQFLGQIIRSWPPDAGWQVIWAQLRLQNVVKGKFEIDFTVREQIVFVRWRVPTGRLESETWASFQHLAILLDRKRLSIKLLFSNICSLIWPVESFSTKCLFAEATETFEETGHSSVQQPSENSHLFYRMYNDFLQKCCTNWIIFIFR